MLERLKKLAKNLKSKNNKEYCVVNCSCGNLDVMESIQLLKLQRDKDSKDKYTKIWCTNDKD